MADRIKSKGYRPPVSSPVEPPREINSQVNPNDSEMPIDSICPAKPNTLIGVVPIPQNPKPGDVIVIPQY